MNLEEMISEKDKEYISKQMSKAIKSYDWEKSIHELFDHYVNELYYGSLLDDVFTDFMEKVIRKMFVEKGLIEDDNKRKA